MLAILLLETNKNDEIYKETVSTFSFSMAGFFKMSQF